MKLTRCYVEGFRNLKPLELRLDTPAQFFLGANGQGKTNLLEAIGLLTALRSFRGAPLAQLHAWDGRQQTWIHCELQHEKLGPTTVRIQLLGKRKQVLLDQEEITRFSDFLGLLPTIAFTSQDIQLLRGAPQLRRRFLDSTLAAALPGYYHCLRQYHRGLAERNRLLKERRPPQEIMAYSQALAPLGHELIQQRTQACDALNRHLQAAYTTLATAPEQPESRYMPDYAPPRPESLLELWQKTLQRDQDQRSTQRGPHRDDLSLRLFGKDAQIAASEGQQRALVLALRFAQMYLLEQRQGVRSLLLADDILNELDSARRARFWELAGEERQILATGTQPPSDPSQRRWQWWQVDGGHIQPHQSPY